MFYFAAIFKIIFLSLCSTYSRWPRAKSHQIEFGYLLPRLNGGKVKRLKECALAWTRNVITRWVIWSSTRVVPTQDCGLLWSLLIYNYGHAHVILMKRLKWFEFQNIYLHVRISTCKQNRSTERCSKFKRSVDMTCSGKNGLNIRKNESPKWDRTGCPKE